MNDEEIMRKFNETFSDNSVEQTNVDNVPVAPYRVTENQNTIPTNLSSQNTSNNIPPLVNNTQVNVNQVDVNQSSVNPVNYGQMNNQNVDKMMQVDNTNYTTYQSQQNYGSNVNYNYVPSYGTTKKKKTVSFKMPAELKPIMLIVLVLFIIILIIPTVYDLVTGL